MGQADRPTPGIAAGIAVNAEEMDRAREVEAGLFLPLAAGGGLDRLIDREESTRERPVAGERAWPPSDQEHPEAVDRGREDREVDGGGRTRIIREQGGGHGSKLRETDRRPSGREAVTAPLTRRSSLRSMVAMDHQNHEDLGEPSLDPLVETLAGLDGPADEAGDWPTGLWEALERSGVTRWSLPRELGGEGCDRMTLLRRYARVAEGSMTAAFILSQHDAGVRRLVAAIDRPIALAWLQKIDAWVAFPTVGISQLTTSRRHAEQAVRAEEIGPGRFQVDGLIPWVTAASRADVVVAGAATTDGRQILFALPTDRAGVRVKPAFALAALQASCTAEVACEGVMIDPDDVLVGPSPDVMASPAASGTGGLETSALAIGQALAALKRLEATDRDDLIEPAGALRESWDRLRDDLMACASGTPGSPTSATVRSQANALVLRTTQAYLTARKGSGFLRDDPAQRWARQALFFLVWSCPSPVAQAAIRDLAGLCSA